MTEIVGHGLMAYDENRLTGPRDCVCGNLDVEDQDAGASAIGGDLPAFDDKTLPEKVVRGYRVVYRVIADRQEVEVMRFWQARQGYLAFE